MGTFLDYARRSNALSPRRRGFTEQSWGQAFDERGPYGEEDIALRDVGLQIASKLDAIRSARAGLSTAELSPSTQLRAFVAAANYNTVRARALTIDAIRRQMEGQPEGTATGLELVFQVRLATAGGAVWSPSEIVESTTDAIEIPIRLTLAGGAALGHPRMQDVSWAAVALEVNLGITYRFAEDVWDNCLWNDYRMVDGQAGRVFLPLDMDVVRAHVVGVTRAEMRGGGFNLTATAAIRRAARLGVPARLPAVLGIARRGRRQVIRLAPPGVSQRSAETFWVMRALAVEPFYEELLDEPLPALDGLSLSHVLDAWMIVAQACHHLHENLIAIDAAADGQRPLSDFAPVLEIAALAGAIQAALNISREAARRLLDFLTFSAAGGRELWAQPLVPVSDTALAPVLTAAVHPQLRRVIDVWMRQLNVDLALRGPAFEAFVRTQTAEGIWRSPLLRERAQCLADDGRFRPTTEIDDQIDLLFVVGDTVFVGECKCILEPTDAKSLAMHRKTVEEGAAQAKLRAEHIDAHRDAFQRFASERGMHVDAGFQVKPLVVVSTSTFAGMTVDDVPVIDTYILGRFFDGAIERVSVSGDLEARTVSSEPIYTSADEAVTVAHQYFSRPPQLQPYLDGISPRLVPIFSVTEDDWSAGYLTLDCNPVTTPPPSSDRASEANEALLPVP